MVGGNGVERVEPGVTCIIYLCIPPACLWDKETRSHNPAVCNQATEWVASVEEAVIHVHLCLEQHCGMLTALFLFCR